MRFSIPSEIATLDSDRNGIVDRLYVGDMGGQVWRVDLPEGVSADTDHRKDNWTVTLFAELAGAGDSNDRRIFHKPDVVQTRDSVGAYDAVIVATGDRANPLETTDTNRLVAIKDRFTVSGNPSATAIVAVNDLVNATGCGITCDTLDVVNGWYVNLPELGEKGLSSPLIANGLVFFTSYVPNTGGSNSCAPAEGDGRLYVMNLTDASAAFDGSIGKNIGPGIPASPIALSGDLILLPGTGLQDVDTQDLKARDKLISLYGRSIWKLYWRSSGKDQL